MAKRAKSVIPTDIPLIGVPWILGALASLYGHGSVVNALPVLANVLISNVPGPPVPLFVGGYRMTGYWPLSIVEHGVGLNITLMSYDGRLCLGFIVARCAVPDARELAHDFLDAYEEMKQRMLPPRKAARKSTGTKTTTAPRRRLTAKRPVAAGAAVPPARAQRSGKRRSMTHA